MADRAAGRLLCAPPPWQHVGAGSPPAIHSRRGQVMKLLFASLSLLCALSLSKLQAGDPLATGAPAASPALELAADDAAARAARTAPDDGDASTCPYIWRCDDTGGVYDTRASCRAECPGACSIELFCDGFCICP
jgi:hypothetical protein